MLAGLDVLLVDLQDVGTRYYTYVYTMLLVLKACAREGEGRRAGPPNPLGAWWWTATLDPAFASFVGLHPLPVRHG